jgi:predicted Rossmann-fold nucleotide-binding protein
MTRERVVRNNNISKELCLRRERFPNVYATFLKYSDQIQVESEGLTWYLSNLQQILDNDRLSNPTIFEFGPGNGQLTAAYMSYLPQADYCGMDHQKSLIEETRNRLRGMNLKRVSLIEDFFLPDTKLKTERSVPDFNNADLVIASHSGYTSVDGIGSIEEFMRNVFDFFDQETGDSIGIMIHSSGLEISHIRQELPDICPETKTVCLPDAINECVSKNEKYSLISHHFTYSLSIPKLSNDDWEKLINLNNQVENLEAWQEVKNLIEFISTRALEFLTEDQRRKLICKIREKAGEDSILKLGSEMQIIYEKGSTIEPFVKLAEELTDQQLNVNPKVVFFGDVKKTESILSLGIERYIDTGRLLERTDEIIVTGNTVVLPPGLAGEYFIATALDINHMDWPNLEGLKIILDNRESGWNMFIDLIKDMESKGHLLSTSWNLFDVAETDSELITKIQSHNKHRLPQVMSTPLSLEYRMEFKKNFSDTEIFFPEMGDESTFFPSNKKKIGVFSGVESKDQALIEAAKMLGAKIGNEGHNLICGAGSQNIMGGIAKSAFTHGSEVTGVTTAYLYNKYENPDKLKFLRRLGVTENMASRYKWMITKPDALVVFPGGLGVIQEILAAIYMKINSKLYPSMQDIPITLLNIKNDKGVRHWGKLIEYLKDRDFLKYVNVANEIEDINL